MAPTHIATATRVEAAGTPPKLIDEYIDASNSGTEAASVAHMRSPAGWSEPAETPDFDEFTVVLAGSLLVRHRDGDFEVRAGEAVIAHAGEWIQYSTPEGAEYIAVCLPAFSPDTVHRVDDELRRLRYRVVTPRRSRIASSSASASTGSMKWTASMPNSRAAATLSALSSTKTASSGVDLHASAGELVDRRGRACACRRATSRRPRRTARRSGTSRASCRRTPSRCSSAARCAGRALFSSRILCTTIQCTPGAVVPPEAAVRVHVDRPAEHRGRLLDHALEVRRRCRSGPSRAGASRARRRPRPRPRRRVGIGCDRCVGRPRAPRRRCSASRRTAARSSEPFG